MIKSIQELKNTLTQKEKLNLFSLAKIKGGDDKRNDELGKVPPLPPVKVGV